MPKTQLAKDVDVSLNIAYQLDGPFLIGESTSTRASVIGRLTGVHVVDAAIREVNKKVSNHQRDIKSELRREEELTERLANEFNDIPEIENKVNELTLLLTRAETIEKKLNQLTSLEAEYNSAATTIKESTQGLVQINSYLPKVLTALAEAEVQMSALNNLRNIQNELSTTDYELQSITTKLKSYRGLKKIISTLDNTKETVSRLNELRAIQNDFVKVDKDISNIDSKLAKLPSVPEEVLKEAEEAIIKLTEIQSYSDEYQDLIAKITSWDKAIDTIDDNLVSYRSEYKEVLKELGKCPTCYTPIDDTIIDRIEL